MPSDGIEDVFTETTSQSWFSRLGGALTGLLIGLVLVPGSSVLLFWNEGRAVQTAQSLAEGAGLVLPVERLDRANEGRLVHVSGPAHIATPPRDPDLGVAAPEGTIRLNRRVEMFQWKEEQESETRNKLGGGTETVTTYRYTRVWAEGRIDSGRFRQPQGHQNPPLRYASREFPAQGVTLNGYRLTAAQLDSCRRMNPCRRHPATPPRACATARRTWPAPSSAISASPGARHGRRRSPSSRRNPAKASRPTPPAPATGC